MKTWEIHERIEEFRERNTKFKLTRSPITIRTSTNKAVPIGSVVSVGSFGMHENTFFDLGFEGTLIECNNAFAEWEEVKEPVDFMTAFTAWYEGKNIYCELRGNEYRFSGANAVETFGAGLIKNGEWYIEG